MNAAVRNGLDTCKCDLGKVVRHINSSVLNGKCTVPLDEFKQQLLCSKTLIKLNECLKRHGFRGSVRFLDHICLYHE